jgi:hypothetical protein
MVYRTAVDTFLSNRGGAFRELVSSGTAASRPDPDRRETAVMTMIAKLHIFNGLPPVRL